MKITRLNIYTLGSVFGDAIEVPNKLEATALNGMRRCLRAGLVEADKSSLRLTAAGIAALRAFREVR